MMLSIMSGSDIRETPPWARMSAGTRSSAMTATAPASSAIFACSAVTTSMMTPPLSISAMPRLTRAVPTSCCSDMRPSLRRGDGAGCRGRQSAGHPVACPPAGSALKGRPLGRKDDPGVAGNQRQRLAVGHLQRRAGTGRPPRPRAVDALAVPEHRHGAGADAGGELRRVAVDVGVLRVRHDRAELDDHVRRRPRLARGVDLPLAPDVADVLLQVSVPPELDRGAV